MTIGIGVLCGDGIVLGADTQVTLPGVYKVYERKLFCHDDSARWTAVLAFCGSVDFMRSFNERFADEMQLAEQNDTVTSSTVRDSAQNVLSALAPVDGTALLIGVVRPDGEMKLYVSREGLVSPVKTYDFVGVGDTSILRFLAPFLARDGMRDASHAALATTYLILAAKRHIDGCGGETDIRILRPSGAVEVYGHSTIASVEQALSMVEHFAGNVFSGLLANVDESEFNAHLDRLCARLRDEHVELQRYFRQPRRLRNHEHD